MAIIASHSTARMMYRAPRLPRSLEWVPPRRAPFKGTAPCADERRRLRSKLSSYGIPEYLITDLHVMVPDRGSRRFNRGVVCHVHGFELAPGSLGKLGGGMYVVDIRLCALQAAGELSFRELVEYLYEICGSYALPLEADDPYIERRPLTSVAALTAYGAQMKGARGGRQLRRALRYVRDGARSPMETALIMMLVLPKREGGLGLRDVEMDYRIDIWKSARSMTTKRFFVADMYVKKAHLDIEYHGIIHEREGHDVSDEERENTLRAMGHRVIVVRRGAFFNRDAFRRLMSAICRAVQVRPSTLPDDFCERQEELRQFVLRRML
ncbi:MAG: hypothetical protein E7001_06590 [Coriobacteriaceae bacterium]|nr:hypothetical protein [Coriobacteriaceae bacterium]